MEEKRALCVRVRVRVRAYLRAVLSLVGCRETLSFGEGMSMSRSEMSGKQIM